MIQTRDGYLWIGTHNGFLVRFDGNHFTVFDENNTPGLTGGGVVFLFEDSRTNLWIGTEKAGIALLRDGKIKHFETDSPSPAGQLLYAYEDSNGVIWFYMTDGHSSRYQNGKMVFDASTISLELVLRATKRLIPSASGGFWLTQNGRVQKLIGNQIQRDLGVCPWKANTPVTAACEDHDGNLIVGTLGEGVFWYDANGNYHQVSTKHGLSSMFVLSLCMDREGNLWVGTDGEGLNRVRKKVFNSPDGNHSWVAQSISEDERGGLWMTFNALEGFRGASYWFSNSVQDFGGGRLSNPRAILVDHAQHVWVGTGGEGLFQFQSNHFQPVSGAEIAGRQISALFEDRAGQLWVGSQNGLACWNGRNWKLYSTRDGLSENSIRAIAEDAGGNLWVGTESRGLNFFQNGKFVSYRADENGLPGEDISCLCVDKSGVLWVGTSGHGLNRFKNGKWTRYSTLQGLAGNSISYIIEEGQDYLWVGSNAGLMRVKKSSLDEFADKKADLISCRTYGKADGLPARECSSGSQPAACRTRDGTLWFPTIKGLVSVNPAQLKPNLQPPLVKIESVFVDHQEQKTNPLSSSWTYSIIIPPGREQLEVHYTGLNFSAPKEVRFRYRLEGHETSWTEAGNVRVAHYPKISPGQYRFHVIARNEDGIEASSILEVMVQPQFWQTRGFLAVVIVFLLGTIVASVRYVSTQKLLRQLQSLKQQEALEHERSRIARDLHDQLGANLTQVALLSEMAEADKHSPDEIESHAQQISQTARETTRSLDEIVWAVNPSNDTLDGLINYACKYAQDYLAMAELRYRVDIPTHLPAITIPPEVRHNVFLAFKEAVNNVVKHAHASEVWIRLRLQPGDFTLEIEDNGRGLGNMDASAAQTRNGLRNMRKRMDDIHGEFLMSPGTNDGSIVRLKIPLGKIV